MEPQERFIMKKISKRREDMKKKIVQVEKSSTKEPVDIKIQQVTKQEVLPDEGLTFFIMGGEECSDFQGLNQTKDQRLKNDGYEKHAALSNLQNFMDMDDEKITEKVIFPDLLEITCSEYEDDQIRIEKEQEYIFVPSSSPVINRDKLPKNMIPRILEDEGFYIKKKPEAYKRTCNKMENRLLILEEGKCWFEESGEIISLPSPIKQSWNFRKLITVETLNPGLKTIYKKAIKSDIESCFRSKIEGQREMCQLDLNVSMLQFSHHPLFNQEQVLCSRLLQLYECFQNRQQQNIPHLLYEKLKALTKVASDNLKINQLTKKSLQDYNWQISNTKQLYDLEQKKNMSLLHSMLKTWKQIKVLRQRQGFISTPIKLQFQSMLRNVDARGVPGIPWLINTQKLFQWADEVRIDPNDPDYSDLMEFIMYTRHKGQAIPKYFRLEQLQEEFNFVSEEEIKKNKRFQLLQLRNAGQLDVSVLQQMPLYDREIPDLVFQEYESQIEKDIQISDVNSITSQRIHSINFMKKIRKLVMKKIVKVNKFNLSDVVTDYEEIVSASQLKHAICQLVERRRNLKPQRRERKKVAAQTIGDGDIHLLVRILRAYNIPSRKPALSRSPGHDYSFSNLSKIKDNIYVNIFDETVIEKHEDHCLKGCSGHSYIRKNWLGSVIFPFSALLQQPKISGTFQVNIPPLLLGYTWSKTYVSPKEDYNGQNLKECTFLNIFATIEPQISSVISNTESDKFTDEPDITLLQRAQIFRKDCEAIFPNRRIITTVFNDEGANILVTRYIRALNPPKQLLDLFLSDSNATLDIIARFVSLIPCLPDTLNENDGFDIWMSPEHCINLTIGNKEEHAILLCNYFLYFGKKAWVLLGTSTLEGQVAYVLTQETDEYLLWNPLTGQSHKQFDPFCPLQSADCLFDNENVWFNIQHNSTPMSVHFDNSRESSWKQLLPKNIQIQWMKSETAQPKEILYFDTNKSMVEDLKNRIERTLKCKLMEWRPKQPTRWNRQCTAILRQILPKLELGTGSLVSIEDESEFERLLQFYWVSGFPIQLPYTDLQSITNAVYQTGIHSSEFPQTEFALAVYIHAYPNNILSIWIYLASLVRHQ
uniref:Protein CC2D2B isoform X12 n=1 Tax=Phascolarctos cinereus TaxID=38626 RepID=A0A6P5L6Y8_PHACI|nr:protein CC2D2B isoform X12 [Phascolarctos cinereus]